MPKAGLLMSFKRLRGRKIKSSALFKYPEILIFWRNDSIYIFSNSYLFLCFRHQGGSGERAPGPSNLKYSQSLKDPTKDPKVRTSFFVNLGQI